MGRKTGIGTYHWPARWASERVSNRFGVSENLCYGHTKIAVPLRSRLMFAQPSRPSSEAVGLSVEHSTDEIVSLSASGETDSPAQSLIGIDEVQKALNRSRASVYRYTNTDPRNINPPFNPRKLNPEFRSDIKQPLMFHANEVARFARDVLRIKEVTVEVLNAPSTATQQLLGSILSELMAIRERLDTLDVAPDELQALRDQNNAKRVA
jgi:hypothetical protein